MAKRPAGLVDPRLAKALSHPMRARILDHPQRARGEPE